MSDLVFYVYEHWRPDTGACFYVGKGKGKRAWDMKNVRNRHHKAITSKLTALGLAVDVRIVVKDISAEAAYALEVDRIAFYGLKTLANMTGGGEGLINPTPETREKISVAHKKRWEDPGYRRRMKEAHRNRPIVGIETRAKLSVVWKGKKRPPETIERMRAAAKKRGVPQATRDAAIKAITGRPRVPHTPESKELMRIAAFEREAKRRAARG